MNRWTALILTVFGATWAIAGCAGSSNNPLIPAEQTALQHTGSSGGGPQTHLWGYYDCSVDLETMTVTAVPNRQSMFTANVTTYINGKPSNLKFKVNDTVMGPGYVDVDIDVLITHPFAGLTQYNGYDVRGILVGSGTGAFFYNTELRLPVKGISQFMLARSVDKPTGAPDGYTRWFNPREFTVPGLFGYTPGLFATSNYTGKAHLNPYKYFADSIGTNDVLWLSLLNNQHKKGVFTAGATNSRNYYIRFPNSMGPISFSYAIIANWESPTAHPSNAVEAIALDCKVTDDVWYLNQQYKGGSLLLDLKVFDWGAAPNSVGVMDEYSIKVDSTVLISTYTFDQIQMTPVSKTTNYCQYKVDIVTNNVNKVDGNEFWVIIEYPGHNYKNSMGVPNLVPENQPLAAFFRYDLKVSPTPINLNPVCKVVVDSTTPVPAVNFSPVPITFDATGTYDPDPHDVLKYEWDFDGDGIYNEVTDDAFSGDVNRPTHLYWSTFSGVVSLRVTDGNTGSASDSVNIQVITRQSKNIPLRTGVDATDIAINPVTGDLLVSYSDQKIWKYPLSTFYQTGSLFIDASIGFYPNIPRFLDINQHEFTIVSGLYNPPNNYNSCFVYNPSGIQLNTYYFYMGQSYTSDVVAMGTNGTFANDLNYVYSYIDGGSIKHTGLRRYEDPGYMGSGYHGYSFTGTNYFGFDKIWGDFLKGCVSDKYGDYIWCVEDEDLYVSRWQIRGSPTNDWVFSSVYFGSGQGNYVDADNGFNQPKDITRDNQNRLFIFDRLSTGAARVKAWTVNGGTANSIGGFGNSTTISGAPLRIEGSDYNGNIVVLHGYTSPSPDMISVFVPVEMP